MSVTLHVSWWHDEGSLEVSPGLWEAGGGRSQPLMGAEKLESCCKHLLASPWSIAEGQEDTILSYEPVTRQESKSCH